MSQIERKYEMRNVDQLGIPIDFRLLSHEPATAAQRVLETLRNSHIATIVNFPPDPDSYVSFARLIGTPMLKHSSTGGGGSMDYIGEVKFRPDIDEEKRMPTQGSEELTFHTARAYTTVRPRYFALLMADPGWRDQKPGLNGESLLVRWNDVMEEFVGEYPHTASSDLHRFMTTNIRYAPWYVKNGVANEPIMKLSSEGDVEVRYWENIVPIMDELVKEVVIDDGDAYFETLQRFDYVANTCSKTIEYPMAKGQLTIMDNRRIAHARYPFLASRLNDRGEMEHNPRKIYSVHILAKDQILEE